MRSRDLERVTLRLPDDAMRVLRGLMVLRDLPAWRVVADLLSSQRDALDAPDKRALARLVSGRAVTNTKPTGTRTATLRARKPPS